MPDAAEGLRRGPARGVPLHGDVPGRGHASARPPARTPRSPSGSTTCCCRSSRASAPSAPREQLLLSLQTLGGSGYLQDYPIEQYIRDAKIDSLYEGTTAIQSLDFFFRKIVRDNGQALGHVAGRDHSVPRRRGRQRAAQGGAGAARHGARRRAGHARRAHRLPDGLGGGPASVYKVGQNTVRLLMAVGDLLVGWLLLRQAEVALTALGGEPSARDEPFYEGKVAVARFFARTVLPQLTAQRAIVENTDNTPDGARGSRVLNGRTARSSGRSLMVGVHRRRSASRGASLAGMARFSRAVALVGRRFARPGCSRCPWSHHLNASGRAARCALRYGEGRVGELPTGWARCEMLALPPGPADEHVTEGARQSLRGAAERPGQGVSSSARIDHAALIVLRPR